MNLDVRPGEVREPLGYLPLAEHLRLHAERLCIRAIGVPGVAVCIADYARIIPTASILAFADRVSPVRDRDEYETVLWLALAEGPSSQIGVLVLTFADQRPYLLEWEPTGRLRLAICDSMLGRFAGES